MNVHLYDIPIDHFSADQLDTLFRSWVQGHGQKMIVTPNPEMVLAARKDRDFLRLLRKADVCLPDGVGLCYATAALTDARIQFRTTGVDTLVHLARVCEDHGKRLVLLGGAGDVSAQAARRLRAQFPDLDVIGIDPGRVMLRDQQFTFEFDVIEAVQNASPDVLAVAFGAGKQEAFLDTYLSSFPSARIGIGVGGALDMVSGARPRSPLFLRRVGLEWVWRVMIEPTRAGRIARASIVFPTVVAYDSLRSRRLRRALKNVSRELYYQLIRTSV